MNYYQRHIGDYSKDTRFLSTYQHGVYALFLDWYYSNERPIPLELAYRIVQARSGPERRAVDEVLNTFFDLIKAPGFAHNKRADLDLSKYKVKSEANSLIAQERESTKRARNVLQNQTPSCSSGEPSHKPVTSNQEEEQKKEAKASLSAKPDPKPAIPPCPHQEILELYHRLLPANPGIKVWDGAREEALRTRWREDAKRQSLAYWERFFGYVASSPFLTGRQHGSNDRPFLPGLEWMVKAANFAKIIEGRYHDKGLQQ